MKSFMLLLTVVFPLISQASLQQTISLDQYLYAGTLAEMTKSLENQLVSRIESECGNTSRIEIKNLAISFELGLLSSGTGLSAEIIEVDGKPAMRFPHHPKATISASFQCD